MLRLPGMRSRLEVTHITWVREIPLSAPRHSHEYEHQERYVSPGTRLVPHQYPFTSNQPRLRAASDPFSFSSRSETALLAPFDSYIPTPTCSTPRETHENTPIKASSLRPSHGHSLSFAASERHRVPCTLMPNSAITLSPGHDATCASVAMRARSDSPLHSGSSILSPSSTLAGPSKALLDILNSSFTDTQLPSIPLPHVLPAIGLGSAQDPPVFRPKPIGSASYFRPTGHRRLSNSSAREVLHSLPAATPGTDQQAPPWPPVL
ncbi:hypothetical protein BDY19DRAFT_938682 [Irpex rosettiformis]|uniref:Uncharacterized protein n=1 Tax=Irpex rosettiformis TaxID=378272 RepID=A0ACB8U6Y4_9APHY|nr:hypothetical protein BDY19DRAFT_938682 [Irpex rosettiformis]